MLENIRPLQSIKYVYNVEFINWKEMRSNICQINFPVFFRCMFQAWKEFVIMMTATYKSKFLHPAFNIEDLKKDNLAYEANRKLARAKTRS